MGISRFRQHNEAGR